MAGKPANIETRLFINGEVCKSLETHEMTTIDR